MTIRAAITRLASLSVSGISHNYDVDSVPDTLNRVQLPALLVLPITPSSSKITRTASEGFQSIAFSSGPRTVTVSITHLLLVAPTEAGHGVRTHLPKLVDLMDTYCTTLAADPLLNNTLLEPTRVQVEPGDFTYGHTTYHGCAFRHTWIIQV